MKANKKLIIIVGLFIITATLTFLFFKTDIKKTDTHSIDKLAHLKQPSPDGKYYLTTNNKSNDEWKEIFIYDSRTNSRVSNFDVEIGKYSRILWFKDSKRFIYSDSKSTYLWNVEKNSGKEIPIVGHELSLNSDETLLGVSNNEGITIYDLNSNSIKSEIKFPEHLWPSVIISWNQDGLPKYVSSNYSNDDGSTIIKIDEEQNILELNLEMTDHVYNKSVDNKFAVFNKDLLFYDRLASNSTHKFDINSEETSKVTDKPMSLVALSPDGTKIGSFINGIQVFNQKGEIIYEDDTGHSFVKLWKWLDQETFVIVYQKVYASGLFGDSNRIEIHDVSRGERLERKYISNPTFDNVFFTKDSQQIFSQNEDEVNIYDLR
ncbi:hypothetical protein [Aquisalibacillus elongatus]|uniref:WD40 repeat protein n=1 Tax=Aquisalibacillus elongatus TaxID=485577 RepID=A0A3N5C3X9_9BACI|nr:hypothetical protein [Aquisalibacillus elongatus]RPF54162.1 hypothetical protein EDC24_1354 [Aquisalibacillus elongatus]